jgi:hypothetical protein
MGANRVIGVTLSSYDDCLILNLFLKYFIKKNFNIQKIKKNHHIIILRLC